MFRSGMNMLMMSDIFYNSRWFCITFCVAEQCSFNTIEAKRTKMSLSNMSERYLFILLSILCL